MQTRIPTMLTVKQTATTFRLPEFWIRRALKQGRVPYITLGRKILINAELFSAFLNGGVSDAES